MAAFESPKRKIVFVDVTSPQAHRVRKSLATAVVLSLIEQPARLMVGEVAGFTLTKLWNESLRGGVLVAGVRNSCELACTALMTSAGKGMALALGVVVAVHAVV
jgi:hypothetical protein